MSNRNLLIQVFNEAESIRRSIDPDLSGIRCPICWHEFGREAIQNKEVSVEDVPQKSWGEICKVITCVMCNNDFGHKYQGKASSLKKLENLKAGNASKRLGAKVVIDKEDFNGYVYNDRSGQLYIKGIRKNNRPEIADYWLGRNQDKIRASSMQILIKEPYDDEAVERVLLRDSYLLTFYCLGYSYLRIEQVQDVRRIIDKHLPVPKIAVFDFPSFPFSNQQNGSLYWIQAPEELAGILVQWNVPTLGNRFVLMPFFPYKWPSYEELCMAWHEKYKSLAHIELNLIEVEFDKSVRYSEVLSQKLSPDGKVIFVGQSLDRLK